MIFPLTTTICSAGQRIIIIIASSTAYASRSCQSFGLSVLWCQDLAIHELNITLIWNFRWKYPGPTSTGFSADFRMRPLVLDLKKNLIATASLAERLYQARSSQLVSLWRGYQGIVTCCGALYRTLPKCLPSMWSPGSLNASTAVTSANDPAFSVPDIFRDYAV